jgi:SAM-dependent methyltransferase
VYALPYPDRAFDVVVATEVLEHLHDPSGAVRELLRVARKAVILTVPHEPWWRLANMMRGKYLSDFGNTPGHVQHWTRTGFVRLLALQTNAPRVRGVGLWTFATVARA